MFAILPNRAWKWFLFFGCLMMIMMLLLFFLYVRLNNGWIMNQDSLKNVWKKALMMIRHETSFFFLLMLFRENINHNLRERPYPRCNTARKIIFLFLLAFSFRLYLFGCSVGIAIVGTFLLLGIKTCLGAWNLRSLNLPRASHCLIEIYEVRRPRSYGIWHQSRVVGNVLVRWV